jgi:hypothetical protein
VHSSNVIMHTVRTEDHVLHILHKEIKVKRQPEAKLQGSGYNIIFLMIADSNLVKHKSQFIRKMHVYF